MESNNLSPNIDQMPLVELTSDIVCAYVANNPVPIVDLAGLIASTYQAVAGLAAGRQLQSEEAPQKPAVNPKRSVFDDHIVCLEDGKKFKSLKRHLSILGMTPAEYRTKWQLPADYPMVAPGYARQRSELAKAIGLGRKSAKPAGRSRSKKAAA